MNNLLKFKKEKLIRSYIIKEQSFKYITSRKKHKVTLSKECTATKQLLDIKILKIEAYRCFASFVKM